LPIKIKGTLVVKAKAPITPSKLKKASKTSRYINFEKQTFKKILLLIFLLVFGPVL